MSEAIEKPTPKHPARFTRELLPIFDEAIRPLMPPCDVLAKPVRVLDPFAGTGRIHDLRDMGPYATVGVEIEREWASMSPFTLLGNALALQWSNDAFDAIVTSPTYGNRFADKHNAKDGSERRSYRHDLGRDLNEFNSGGMQWGEQYRAFHLAAWSEAIRVLRPGGRFVLNIKDHIRKGQRQWVAGWHVTTLARLGLDLLYHVEVETPGMRFGANSGVRLPTEQVYIFRLPKEKAK